MKKIVILLITCLYIFVFPACDSKSSISYSTNPIVKTIGEIDVIVDPNVEMMMIIGRLSGAQPYNFSNSGNIPYINEVDAYFEDFKYEPAIFSLRNNKLIFGRIPEYGMYLNETVTGYIMDIDDKNFIVQTAGRLPAKEVPYFAGNIFLKQISNFRQTSNFDTFFIEHTADYEKIIDEKISILNKYNFKKWLEIFYGIKIKEHIYLYLTHLTGGGSFGIIIKNSKGKDIPHAVITADPVGERHFLFLVAHEFSHPRTLSIAEKLYENDKIKAIFSDLFNKNSDLYISQGYGSDFVILNETVNQACANKYLEKVWTESEMKTFNEKIIENYKWVFVPQIAEFLDNYENNRKRYKTLEDFVPELEKFISNLD